MQHEGILVAEVKSVTELDTRKLKSDEIQVVNSTEESKKGRYSFGFVTSTVRKRWKHFCEQRGFP